MDLPGGASVTLESARPVTEGWCNTVAVNPRLLRCTADDGRTVIVKMRRPPGDTRRRSGFRRELSALLLLAELDCDAGPRLLATDDSAGLLVLEDLGDGPALEDLLVGSDPAAATAAFVALAEAVGRMHTATLGQADGIGPPWFDVAEHWSRIGELTETEWADRDVAELLEILASGPMALSNGDLAPQNCRLRDGRMRLLDFEDAACQHPLLDAAQFRLPFYGGPCWARIPPAVGAEVEAAYRAAAGRAADRAWAEGMAAAVGAWTIIRLVRVPKLLDADPPHPMGFSRRGQLLDTLQVGAEATATVLPRLSAWFAATEDDLRSRWPGLPESQDVYPAYR
ncbi:phosphotransferase [Actinoplanes sp. NPDC051633]|uniref:phosphotransferase n=1 Tax=Actinoplanes sp. NPDC051633 TaxID=3155670 RepID=UPI00341DA2EB